MVYLITALFNHSTYGAENILDWIVIVMGLFSALFGASVFFEYKMMGLFSMLFGVGLMIFLDNAKQKVNQAKITFHLEKFFITFIWMFNKSYSEED